MVSKFKNIIILAFINIFFVIEIKSNGTLEFKLSLSENQAGFHRDLCYEVLLQNMAGISSIVLKQALPKDMYVDSYQVLGNNKILVKDIIDCEIPAYLASPHEVMLCSLSKSSAHEMCMPVHFRYQVPHDCKIYGQSIIVNMAAPSISVKKIDNYSDAVTLECFKDAESFMYHEKAGVQPFHFQIPVGCTEDFYPVLFLIVITIPLSVVYLSLSLMKANEAFSNVL